MFCSLKGNLKPAWK